MKNNGGPAFPQAPDGHPDNKKPGMSLRDYFAAAALQGLASACDESGTWQAADPSTAKAAYELADAMLAERDK